MSDIGCAVLHTDAQGHSIPCPGDHPEQPPALSEFDQLRADNESLRYMVERARWALGTDEPIPSNVARPPAAVYEVRTVSGITYRAEGDVIEQGDGWFTLWADKMVMALRLPEADIRSIRAVGDEPDSGSLELLAHGMTEERVREIIGSELDALKRTRQAGGR